MEKDSFLPDSCLSINAYLGASGIVKALDEGADIVITGRVVDSALVLGPLMHEYHWEISDYDLLSSGSLAGHIIECGAQCTGGNYTDWREVKGFENIGFPFVDVFSNGDFIVSVINLSRKLKIEEHFLITAFAITSPFLNASLPPITKVPIALYPSI